MFRDFSSVETRTQLSFGDLLEGATGQRHAGPVLELARRLWPRPVLRRLFRRHGLMLLIDATK